MKTFQPTRDEYEPAFPSTASSVNTNTDFSILLAATLALRDMLTMIPAAIPMGNMAKRSITKTIEYSFSSNGLAPAPKKASHNIGGITSKYKTPAMIHVLRYR